MGVGVAGYLRAGVIITRARNMPGRHIPEAIKREVRRQCCFGCVLCGSPFFEYDHIEEFAEVREHAVENLALLCPTHHSSKTTSKLPVDRLRHARDNPFNAGKPATSTFRLYGGHEFELTLGTNKVLSNLRGDQPELICIWINGFCFLALDLIDDWVVPSMTVTDLTGQTVMDVQEGEVRFSTALSDYRYEGDRLRAWREGEQILDMRLSGAGMHLTRGAFLIDGDGFVVGDEVVQYIASGVPIGRDQGTVRFDCVGGIGMSRPNPPHPKPCGFAKFINLPPR